MFMSDHFHLRCNQTVWGRQHGASRLFRGVTRWPVRCTSWAVNNQNLAYCPLGLSVAIVPYSVYNYSAMWLERRALVIYKTYLLLGLTYVTQRCFHLAGTRLLQARMGMLPLKILCTSGIPSPKLPYQVSELVQLAVAVFSVAVRSDGGLDCRPVCPLSVTYCLTY